MCGIAGVIGEYNRERVSDAVASLHHRGPDSDGRWLSPCGRAHLVHTRLSIIDLSPTGAQPMIDEEGQNVIVFNGEIYNHEELRRGLKREGVRFSGTSDTEVVLKGFSIHGPEYFKHLNGMFAFLIWNDLRKEAVCVRDRFGIKPFYYYQHAKSFYFASETRAISALSGHHFHASKRAISDFLFRGSCPSHNLLPFGIKELPPATIIKVNRDGAMGEAKRYWQCPRLEPPRSWKREQAVEEVRSGVIQSVKSHLVSDVPVAVLLSGGLDSSIITSVAAACSPLKTFSVGFEEKEFDESAVARLVSEKFGTEHHHIVLSESEVLDAVKASVFSYDLPSADGLNTYIVSRAVARHGIKVALSGLGGDETFGGYSTFDTLSKEKYLAYMPRVFAEILRRTGRGRQYLSDLPRSCDAAVFLQWWRRFWAGSEIEAMGLPKPAYLLVDDCRHLDEFGRISWADIRHYMKDTLLRDADCMSMAVSLELRVPFLDHQLVGLALNIPGRLKRRPGTPKAILLDAFRRDLPTEVYDRRKMGFFLPMKTWMDGPLREFIAEGIDLAARLGGLDRAALLRACQQPATGHFFWQKTWSVVVLGFWLRRNLGAGCQSSRADS